MKVNQIFISSEKRSGGTKELMTLRWTETDVDAGRVNFTCGETERGRSDLSRSTFLFRDFRSRMCYTIEIFCDTAFRDLPRKFHRSMGNAYKLPWKFSHLKFSLLFILGAFASAVFEMHAIAENP